MEQNNLLDDYDDFIFYCLGGEERQHKHDGNHGNNIVFNSKYTNRPDRPGYSFTFTSERRTLIKKPSFTHYDLGHTSNKGLTIYLIFCFILANDSLALHLLLQDVQSGLQPTISFADIEQFDESICFGILQSRKFKSVLDKYVDCKFDGRHGLYQRKMPSAALNKTKSKEVTGGFSYDQYDINLLLLACLTGHLYTINTILNYLVDIEEELFHSILCSHIVDIEVFELLIIRGHLLVFFDGWDSWIEEFDEKFALRSLQALAYSCSRTNDRRKWRLLTKTKKLLNWIKNRTPYSDYSGIFFGVQHCLEISVKEGDSFLFRLLLDNILSIAAIIMKDQQQICNQMLDLAVDYKAYYIVHTLCKSFHFNHRPLSHSYYDDIFLLNNMMKCKSLAKMILDKFAFTLLPGLKENCLAICLIASYVYNKKEYSKQVAAILKALSENQDQGFTYMICNILLRMGFDFDCFARHKGHIPLVFSAIKKGHTNIIRLLIYYNCDIDISFDFRNLKTTDMALKTGRFDILKILLLCGAQKPKDLLIKCISYVDGNMMQLIEDQLWVVSWLQQPHSLKYFCRKAIRRAYAKRLLDVMETIKYPRYLKDYVTTKVLI